MTADPITRLNAALEGRYRIERQLGEGGMATVYLADDLRHERKVALKVLKPELAAVVGADRFLAEIKTTANLQHPHILPLFDSGEADSFLFYVMPYVEGESLRERLDREHQLPVDEAIQIAKNVAEALDYAHSQGVIHRDIKPANILLQAGKPVISDFGIALAVGAAGGGRLTETGLSLGTPHYMSPEQATGDQSVGPATDIYALGCVLYEMLVGEPPFTGSTAQAVLGKIVTGDAPSATEARKSVPPNVDATIRRALEKLPADRFGGAAEFARASQDSGFKHGGTGGVGVTAHRTLWKPVGIGATTLAVLLAATTIWSMRDGALGRNEAVVLSITPPEGYEINAGIGVAISPDERTIIFGARWGGEPAGLFRRSLGRLGPTPIVDAVRPWMPFFSPDGQEIAFFEQSDNILKRLPLDGADSRDVGPAPSTTRSGSWREDGTIVFNSNSSLGGLVTIRASGGQPTAIPGEAGSLRWIDQLPGGTVVIGSQDVDGNSWVVAVDLGTGERKELFQGTTPRYVEPGRIIYALGGDLWAVPFDTDQLEPTGDPVRIVESVQVGTNAFANFAASENLLVFQPGGIVGIGSGVPVWIYPDGHREPLQIEPGLYASPSISPDGRSVAIVRSDLGNNDIYVLEIESGRSTQLTFHPGNDDAPAWMPDGESVVFRSDRDGPPSLYARRADGIGDVARLTDGVAQQPYAFVGDSTLLYGQFEEETGFDVWTLPLSQPSATPLLRADYDETQAAMSPDGRFVAYESMEGGYPEIVVRPYPDLGGFWMVSTGDYGGMSGLPNNDPAEGRFPVWSRDGSWLYYLGGNTLARVPVGTDPTFTFGTPQPFALGSWNGSFDAHPDGRLLMVAIGGAGEARNELVVIQNWAALIDAERSN